MTFVVKLFWSCYRCESTLWPNGFLLPRPPRRSGRGGRTLDERNLDGRNDQGESRTDHGRGVSALRPHARKQGAGFSRGRSRRRAGGDRNPDAQAAAESATALAEGGSFFVQPDLHSGARVDGPDRGAGAAKQRRRSRAMRSGVGEAG